MRGLQQESKVTSTISIHQSAFSYDYLLNETVPEPATLVLIASGLILLLISRPEEYSEVAQFRRIDWSRRGNRR
jgi:hypothetical protein